MGEYEGPSFQEKYVHDVLLKAPGHYMTLQKSHALNPYSG